MVFDFHAIFITDYRSLDNIVMEANNEAVGEVSLELGSELLYNTVKPKNHHS